MSLLGVADDDPAYDMSQPGIMFAAVARSTTILAKQALAAGNFVEVAEQVLARITPENAKMTLSQSCYLMHYVCEDRLVYFCITPDSFERSRAFLFLAEVKQRFCQRYGKRALTALPYAMNSEFAHSLCQLMMNHSQQQQSQQSQQQLGASQSSRQPAELQRLRQQVNELQGIMVRNVDSLVTRGERIELLVDKTSELAHSSVQFRTTSRRVSSHFWWKNVKYIVLLCIVVLLIVYFIVSAACGGLDWPCTRKK